MLGLDGVVRIVQASKTLEGVCSVALAPAGPSGISLIEGSEIAFLCSMFYLILAQEARTETLGNDSTQTHKNLTPL
jgi:hypothetical protein